MKGRSIVESQSNQIAKAVGEAALYEQLAEEATELAQACLKKARKIRAENPTPLLMCKIDCMITEEYSDVCLCADILDLNMSYDVYESKKSRWLDRIKNA